MEFDVYGRIEAIAFLKRRRDEVINVVSASGKIKLYLNSTHLHYNERIEKLEGEIDKAIKEGATTFREVAQLMEVVNSR